jgi:hypothetical protein
MQNIGSGTVSFQIVTESERHLLIHYSTDAKLSSLIHLYVSLLPHWTWYLNTSIYLIVQLGYLPPKQFLLAQFQTRIDIDYHIHEYS